MFRVRLLIGTTTCIGRTYSNLSRYSFSPYPQQCKWISFRSNCGTEKKWFLLHRQINPINLYTVFPWNRISLRIAQFSTVARSEDVQNTENHISSSSNFNKNKQRNPVKKKLKKNQLGQRGQDRFRMKKEQEKNKIEQKIAKTAKDKVRQKSRERLRLAEILLSTNANAEFDNDATEQHLENEDVTNEAFQQMSDQPTGMETFANYKSLQSERPPTFIAPTGSRNVYIAKVACSDQEDSLYAQKLFASSNDGSIPSFFRRGKFYYFPSASIEELPSNQQPEVAFLGRSNAGKSSLINALIHQQLALTSKQPGRTQQAYYYGFVRDSIYDSNLISGSNTKNSALGFIVDLPGYGFARGPDAVVEAWQRKTQTFLLQRRDAGCLKHLFLLQDARTGALALDLSIQGWFDDAEIPYSIIMTKTDCVGPATVAKHANLVCARYTHRYTDRQYGSQSQIAMSPIVYATSSKQNIGISELLATIVTEFTKK